MFLSVVIPCFNEAQTLPRLHEALIVELNRLEARTEILFVDDGSNDATLPVIRDLATHDPCVRYVSLSRNFGKEAAMLAGLQNADGDAVIIMDADLQHPPDVIGRMVDEYAHGADQVVARRTRDGDPWGRMLGARTFYRFVNAMIEVKLTDGAGDFRLLSRRAVDAVLQLPEVNRFSKGLFEWVGYDTVLVDYSNVKRSDGRSKWSFMRLVDYAVDGVISFNDRPLRQSIYIGFTMVLLAASYTVWVVVNSMFFGVVTPGYTTLLVTVTMFGGVQMITLGIIGEYVGRIYRETKRRPHYLVRETERDRQSDRGGNG